VTLARRPRLDFEFGMRDVVSGLDIGHQYQREPSIVRPGKPVLLRVDAAGFDGAEVVAVRSTAASTAEQVVERGTVYPARRTGNAFTAVLPGMPDGTVVDYVVRAVGSDGSAWYGDGRLPLDEATVFTHRVTSRVPPRWTASAVVYQIMVDRFADDDGPVAPPPHPTAWAGGDLHGVRNALGYLEELGVTVVWLTPVFHAASYHGYDAIDLLAVDDRFGGDDALMLVVDDAHRRGIRVVLDLVPNHVSDRHPWFEEARAGGSTRGWFRFTDDGSYDTFFGNPGMPKLQLDHPDARAAMIAAACHWLDRGVDGYRIDHVLGPSESFFAALAEEVGERFPEAWLFGEATATAEYARRYGGLMDGATDFATAYALRDLITGRITLGGFVEVEQEAAAVLPHESFTWVRFVDNHDMDRALRVCGNDPALLARAVDALLALPGVPSILYGTEQGLRQEVPTSDGGLDAARPPMRFDGPAGLIDALRAAVRRRAAASPPPDAPMVWDEERGWWRWGGLEGRLR
jgi:cyclomaltodextrinase / maltogenic alpha-amylase / neopullulanase